MVARGKAERHAARNARLAAALRENLKRRKAQSRGRSGQDNHQGRASGVDEASQTDAGSAAAKTPDFRRNRERD